MGRVHQRDQRAEELVQPAGVEGCAVGDGPQVDVPVVVDGEPPVPRSRFRRSSRRNTASRLRSGVRMKKAVSVTVRSAPRSTAPNVRRASDGA